MITQQITEDEFGFIKRMREKRAAKAKYKQKGKGWRKKWRKDKADIKLNIFNKNQEERRQNRKEMGKRFGDFFKDASGEIIDKLKGNAEEAVENYANEAGYEGDRYEDDIEDYGGSGGSPEPDEKSNTMLYVGIFGGLTVIALVIVLYLRNKK